MSEINLIWCHGSLSRPWGEKSKSLADVAQSFGLTMDAVDFQDMEDPDQRVDRLVERLKEDAKPALLAGSSMGGYVATAAAKHADVLGLFLLAPALYLPKYAVHVFSGLPGHIDVIHGWEDDVIPADNSIRFAKQHKANLHLLPDGHRLSQSIETLESLFTHFLKTAQTHG